VLNRPGGVLRPSWLRQMEADALAAAQAVEPPEAAPPQSPAQVLAVPPNLRSLTLEGQHLQHEAYPPRVTLNGTALDIDELDDDRLVVALPQGFEEGVLEVQLGDQPTHCFALVHEPVHTSTETSAHDAQFGTDPWAPLTGAAS
jgi:hypothetical protein